MKYCVVRPCYYLIWIQQSPACYLDPLPPVSLQPSALLWGSTTTTFSNLYETTPRTSEHPFPRKSLSAPISSLTKSPAGRSHQSSLLQPGALWPRPILSFSDLSFPPQVTVEPCRAAAHLSAAPGDWSVTTSLLTGRGHACHDRYLLTEDRAENCTESQIMKGLSYESVLWLSVLSLPPLPFSSSLLLRLPAGTTKAPFHVRPRRPTLTSSLKSPNWIERDSIKRWDERCAARGGRKVGGRARLKTPDLAGCYFLWAVVSTGEDVIAHLTRIVSSRRSPATARNGNLRG